MDELMGDGLMLSDEFMVDENGEPIVDAEFYHPGLPSSEPPVEEPAAVVPAAPKPACERLAELFDGAQAYRREFFAILDFCRQPQPVDSVKAFVADRQRYGLSAYSPTNLLALLERAGGLAKLGSDGAPYDPSAAKPKEVVVDGVAYYEPVAEVQEIFWGATEDGLALLDAEDPVQKANEMFEARPDYLFIYEGILRLCARPEGGSALAFEEWLAGLPNFAEIPFKPSSFTTKLDEVGAIEWKGAWYITEFGRSLLEQFDRDGAAEASLPAALEM